MGARISFRGLMVLVTIIACLCAGSSVGLAAADKEPSFTLYYSQWTKACIEASDKDLGGCMTAMEARGEAGKFAVAAIFATRAGKPVLRIRLPLGSQLVHGTGRESSWMRIHRVKRPISAAPRTDVFQTMN